jgi:uncharacterized tellurite resistance protein B-like protein
MSLWRRIFPESGPVAEDSAGDTASVRRIAARLAKLPPDEARFLAAFAYVLARLANADLRIDEAESREMERLVTESAGLGSEESALAVEIAKSQARLLGGTENYVVTREFRKLSTPAQRARLVECLYAVAAADRTITNVETTEIAAIADEIGLGRDELASVRARYRDRIAALRPRG